MFRITISSPTDQTVSISIDGEIIQSQFLQSGSQTEVLLEETSVLDSKQIFIETSDEIIDITDYAKEQVKSNLSKPKPIRKYDSISFG